MNAIKIRGRTRDQMIAGRLRRSGGGAPRQLGPIESLPMRQFSALLRRTIPCKTFAVT